MRKTLSEQFAHITTGGAVERQLAFFNSLPSVGVGLLSDNFNQHAFAPSAVEFAVGQTGPNRRRTGLWWTISTAISWTRPAFRR